MCGVFLNLDSQVHTKWPPSYAGQKQADQTWARKVSGVQGQVWHHHHVWGASVWPGAGMWVLFIGLFFNQGRSRLRHLQGHKSTYIYLLNSNPTSPMLHSLILFRFGSEDPWGKHSCACHQYRHPGQPWGSHHWGLHDLWTGSSGESCFNLRFPHGLANHQVSQAGHRFICCQCNVIFFLYSQNAIQGTGSLSLSFFFSSLLHLLVCKSISVVPFSFRIVQIFHLRILNGKNFPVPLFCCSIFFRLTSFLLLQLSGTEDLDNDIDELLHEFETKCQRNVLHCVQFY